MNLGGAIRVHDFRGGMDYPKGLPKNRQSDRLTLNQTTDKGNEIAMHIHICSALVKKNEEITNYETV